MQGQNDSSASKNGSGSFSCIYIERGSCVCLFQWCLNSEQETTSVWLTKWERNSPLSVLEQSSALATGKMLTKYFQQ